MEPLRPNPTLSNDLISEILVRVPVKSLIQFQLVSKTWLSLIKDPVFVKAQLRRAIRSGSDETLMLVRYSCSTSTESAKLKLSLFDVDSKQIVSEIKYPYSQGESRSLPPLTVVGSANGIVCVVLHETSRMDRFFLWNPATRQSSSVIPGRGFSTSRAIGFGYDPVDGDYKIVVVGVMMVFDLNKEVMNCAIKLPVVAAGGVGVDGDDDEDDFDEDFYDAQPETRIIELDKSIAVITLWADASNDDRNGWRYLDKKINMWRLDDDACLKGGGVEASWTIMFCIDLEMSGILLNGYFSNGELLLLIRDDADDHHMWISCDADKKEAKIARVEMAGHHYTHRVERYTESLVSLPGFEQIKDWNDRDDDN
nr:PREDICTED: putative F-box protein At2g16220 [Daucus carota subsp. sativus]